MVDEIHQHLYGSYFEKGLIRVDENSEDVTLTLSPFHATTLYAMLSTVLNHPKLNRTSSDALYEIRLLMQAAKADRTANVFLLHPFDRPQDFYDAPLDPALMDTQVEDSEPFEDPFG